MQHIFRVVLAGSLLALGTVSTVASSPVATTAADSELQTTAKRVLGNLLFLDTDLSEPPGQSCASCHSASRAFADPDVARATSEGATRGLFGDRNAPALGYAAYTPPLYFNAVKDTWVGGLFIDGRAASLEEQAGKPMLNPLEMGNPNKQSVIDKVARAPYAWLMRWLYGEAAFTDTERAFQNITAALAAFERSDSFQPFTAKFDYVQAGRAQFTAQEAAGFALFANMDKGNCASCHVIAPLNDGRTVLFTDFSYDNVGIPRNPDNAFYTMPAQHNPAGHQYIDHGLGRIVNLPEEMGKFKTPTLRNVARTAPYMHNGYFSDLKSIVRFYNDRDIRPRCADQLWTRAADAELQGCWPAPEVNANVNAARLGDLGLTEAEMDAIVAFLETLTDGYSP